MYHCLHVCKSGVPKITLDPYQCTSFVEKENQHLHGKVTSPCIVPEIGSDQSCLSITKITPSCKQWSINKYFDIKLLFISSKYLGLFLSLKTFCLGQANGQGKQALTSFEVAFIVGLFVLSFFLSFFLFPRQTVIGKNIIIGIIGSELLIGSTLGTVSRRPRFKFQGGIRFFLFHFHD